MISCTLVEILSCIVIGQTPNVMPSGNTVIRAHAGPSDIVITTTTRLAGAIHSLRWNGKEFINSTDHGRQLQSASNFDCGGQFFPEVFNPTEAGSMHDGAGPKTTSKLLSITAKGPELHTSILMAFWLRPGEKSAGHSACNDKLLSDHKLTKRVHIGHKADPYVIEYDVTFTVPPQEKHNYAQFEAVTGYMPSEFSRFLKYDATTARFQPLTDGPGEQPAPVVLATPNGSHAMGVFSPEAGPGYGRFRFGPERVVKWNCVFRIRDANGVKPGDYSYKMFVLVGSLEDVRISMEKLHREFRPK